MNPLDIKRFHPCHVEDLTSMVVTCIGMIIDCKNLYIYMYNYSYGECGRSWNDPNTFALRAFNKFIRDMMIRFSRYSVSISS
jgi:hypothetical protein